MIQKLLELSDKNFKITTIGMLKKLEEKVDTMNEKTDCFSGEFESMNRNQINILDMYIEISEI